MPCGAQVGWLVGDLPARWHVGTAGSAPLVESCGAQAGDRQQPHNVSPGMDETTLGKQIWERGGGHEDLRATVPKPPSAYQAPSGEVPRPMPESKR